MKKYLALLVSLVGLTSCTLGNLPDTPPDTITAPASIALYQKAVAGDKASLQKVCDSFARGTNGFPQNKDLSYSAMKMLADRGDVVSQRKLGLAYFHGLDLPQRDAYAENYLRMAAAQGDSQAIKALGMLQVKMGHEAARRQVSENYTNMARAQGKKRAQDLKEGWVRGISEAIANPEPRDYHLTDAEKWDMARKGGLIP